MKTYIFRISLLRNKKISREIEILENVNLYKLAETIIDVYGFDFDHCFGFFDKITEHDYFNSEKQYELFSDLREEGEQIESTKAESVKKTKINEVWQNVDDKMMFLFDYGTSWQFIIELIGIGEQVKNKKYPQLLKKIGRTPKQY